MGVATWTPLVLLITALMCLVGAIVLAPNKRARLVLASSSIAAIFAALGAIVATSPVFNDQPSTFDSVVVYLGVTDSAVIRSAQRWIASELPMAADHTVTVVAVAESNSLVTRTWNKAIFEAAPAEWRHGVTLEAVVNRLDGENTNLGRVPVVVAGVRSANVPEAMARLGQLFERAPGVKENLHLLSLGERLPGKSAIVMPAPRGVSITAPSTLAENATSWPVRVSVDVGAVNEGGMLDGDLFVSGYSYQPGGDASVKGVEITDTNGFSFYNEVPAPRRRLKPGELLNASGEFSAPSVTDPSALLIELRTAYEPLEAKNAFAVLARPQFVVLKKQGGEAPQLFDYCNGLGLDVRVMELDLGTLERAQSNSKLLADFPVLLIDVPLSQGEWSVLQASVASQTPSAALLFVGSGRSPGSPEGWLNDVLSGVPIRDGILRKVGFAWDNSGSMKTQPVSKSDQRLRFTAIEAFLEKWGKQFAQRNTGLLEVIAQSGRGPMSLVRLDENTRYADGTLEAGPAVEFFAGTISNGACPYSDIVIFADPDDVHNTRGPQHFTGDQVAAAKRLENAGCRVYFISVASDFHTGNDSFMTERLKIKMGELGSADAVDLEVERFLYNTVLPRLSVAFETRGAAALDPGRQSQLSVLERNPSLKLIDSLGGPQELSTVAEADRNQVPLWAFLVKGHATPLLIRKELSLGADKGTIQATWLNTSINAEAATRLQSDTSDEMRKMRAALGELFVAALTTASNRVKSSPVVFRSSSDGRRILAFIDTHQPFQLIPSETRVESSIVGGSVHLDDRDLGILRWEIDSPVPAYETIRLEARVSDSDPRIGIAKQAIRFFGLPPTIVGSSEIEQGMSSIQAEFAEETPRQSEAKDGIPRSWFPTILAVALLMISIHVMRS